MEREHKDYYDVLGISKEATEQDIIDAYRRLTKKFHPDLNKLVDAAQHQQEVNEAYEVLRDPEKRKRYDEFGAGWEAAAQSSSENTSDEQGNEQQADEEYAEFYARSVPSLRPWLTTGNILDLLEELTLQRLLFDVLRNTNGELHPDTLAAEERFAWILSLLRRFSEALPHWWHLYEQSKKQFGEKHLNTLIVEGNLADALRNTQCLDNALWHFQQIQENVRFAAQISVMKTTFSATVPKKTAKG